MKKFKIVDKWKNEGGKQACTPGVQQFSPAKNP